MTAHTNDFGDWLKDQRTRRSMRQYELADHLGVSEAHASRLESGARRPTNDHCRRLAQLFAVPVDDVYRIAGRMPPPQPTRERSTLDCIAEDPWLTRDQKAILSGIYSSWVPDVRPSDDGDASA